MQYINEADTYLMVSNYAYGKSQDIVNVDKGFLHGRYIRSHTKKIASEVFIQTQRNKFSLLSSRNLAGGGVRYLFNLGEMQKLYFGAGAFYEKEKLTENNSNETNDDGIRLNFYAMYNFRINKTLRLISTTYYQPATERDKDFRVLEDFSLLSKAGENLELKLSVNISHDSKPPKTVEYTDISYSAGFVYHFSKN